jgi:hypothetical protein
MGNVTFGVLGGKSGKIEARNGKDVAMDGKVGGKNGKGGKDGRRCGRIYGRGRAAAMGREPSVCVSIRLLRCWRGRVAPRLWN